MLQMLGNEEVKIEEAKDTGTSLYIVITNLVYSIVYIISIGHFNL